MMAVIPAVQVGNPCGKPRWEAQVEFLFLGCGVASLWLLQEFGRMKEKQMDDLLSLLLPFK